MCNHCDGRVVSSLDGLENLCEPLVVVLDLGRPGNVIIVCIISGREKSEMGEDGDGY